MRIGDDDPAQAEAARKGIEQHVIASGDVAIVEADGARSRLIHFARQRFRQRLVIQRHNRAAPGAGDDSLRSADPRDVAFAFVHVVPVDVDETETRWRQGMRQPSSALTEKADWRSLFLVSEGRR